eukprot:gene8622-11655_t
MNLQKTENNLGKKKLPRKKLSIRLSKIKYEEKILQIKRVTKVVKGGKKMTFRAIVIIGDNKRKVGVGVGRADDVNLAIDKAVLNGKKNLINVPLTLRDSVPHVIKSSYGACSIMLRPALQGTGVIAGGSVRTVLELAGIKNVLAKQFGSNNMLNNAKATILALTSLNEKIELGKYQFGNAVPLTNIDQEALTKSLLEMDGRNPIIQLVNMYSGVGGKSILTIFSLDVKVVSARQLAFLENIENDNMTIFGQTPRVPEGKELKVIETIFYYFSIIAFNYFYTVVFWDPEKISEQLRKASVSLVDVTPGKDTVVYLNRVVKTASLSGGVLLCYILLTYDIVKQQLNTTALNQVNISSLIILIGVTFEVQKTIKALYKNVL